MLKRPEVLGFSFSQIQCEYLGMSDFKSVYQRALDLQPDYIRLAAYPNRPKTETHYLLKEAETRGIPVILAVGGIKYFRWPEFFSDPELTKYLKTHPQSILGSDPFVKDKITKQLKHNLSEFGGYSNVRILQPGNESGNKVSVAEGITESTDLIETQVKLTRDTSKPDQQLILTCSFPVSQPSFYRAIPHYFKAEEQYFRYCLDNADIVGVNFYTKVPTNNGYLEAGSEFDRRVRLFKKLADQKGKKICGIEVQAEPWEHSGVVHIEKDEYPSCTPQRMTENVTRLLNDGINMQILWGVEHWFKHALGNNPSWINAWKKLQQAPK